MIFETIIGSMISISLVFMIKTIFSAYFTPQRLLETYKKYQVDSKDKHNPHKWYALRKEQEEDILSKSKPIKRILSYRKKENKISTYDITIEYMYKILNINE